ncbi:MAG: endolytic transglycosylase MltG [Lunatimonas sp.]|uniref:endolytic transglycosylase MltG n=1 Tax=Lunatimonas sp. TaxID=2060141 RepID=UPI00263B87F0|nr:endolytic transglycosylase MltG [Lunatimonas sp.]MCC5936284.1 endolytic transglycosylase MltG [Lunatimonas sp.]
MVSEKRSKYIMVGIVAFSVLFASLSFYFYQAFFSPNTLVEADTPVSFYIRTGSDFETVRDELVNQGIVQDLLTFSFVAKVMKYQERVLPGHYRIPPRLSNRELVTLLRSGRQTAVNVTFNNVRVDTDLAEKITRNLEMEEEDFLDLLRDTVLISRYGFEKETILSIFIPNTYQVFWNVSPEGLFDRMYKEYERFWTDERKAKAATLGMSQKEVSTLASIVQAETAKADERPRVAGVYINRLRINMALQADPTLVFALGDFEIKRVLNVHKEIDSPYNTYKHVGLPPGPINLPEISALDAVLNPESHGYLYFCAKDDFSGYHAFATNLRDHMNNARRYQNALNRSKIYK